MGLRLCMNLAPLGSRAKNMFYGTTDMGRKIIIRQGRAMIKPEKKSRKVRPTLNRLRLMPLQLRPQAHSSTAGPELLKFT